MKVKWKQIYGKRKQIGLCAAVLLLALVGIWVVPSVLHRSELTITSEAYLKEIINISKLSTYEAVYNGVLRVPNEKNPDKIDYYVAYESKVKAGIDFENIKVSVDDKEKVVFITLPEVEITDVDVDEKSLDYIFENDKANTETVFTEAYKKCKEDAVTKVNEEQAICELAEESAKNTIKALVFPLIEQQGDGYQLEIN